MGCGASNAAAQANYAESAEKPVPAEKPAAQLAPAVKSAPSPAAANAGGSTQPMSKADELFPPSAHMTDRRSDTMMERRSERMRNFAAPDTDCKKAIYSSGLRASKLSDSEFGLDDGPRQARRSSTTDIDYTRNSEEGPVVDKTAFRRNGARFHSVSTSFGLTRYCAWVNPEANKESWQHREEVTSEHNLRHAAVQFALNDRREGDWMGTYEREIVGDALQKMLLGRLGDGDAGGVPTRRAAAWPRRAAQGRRCALRRVGS